MAGQIRSRPEYVRFANAESTLTKQRDEAHATVRKHAAMVETIGFI
ncbi:MAG: hypothetical protein HOI88_05580 [Phycisphaerae bacterium]|nr:hypothetical protein [Phycisphaerae bacterium]MBT6282339.1 hypothetical protein [Phycisphaerae bacterium]